MVKNRCMCGGGGGTLMAASMGSISIAECMFGGREERGELSLPLHDHAVHLERGNRINEWLQFLPYWAVDEFIVSVSQSQEPTWPSALLFE